MGIARENGYSATVEGFLVVDDSRYRLAKTNGVTFVLAEECEMPPGTEAELLIIVDGDPDTTPIVLPDGVIRGHGRVPYKTVTRHDDVVPF